MGSNDDRRSHSRQNLPSKVFLDVREGSCRFNHRRCTRENRQALLRGIEKMLDVRDDTRDEISDEFVLLEMSVRSRLDTTFRHERTSGRSTATERCNHQSELLKDSSLGGVSPTIAES
jgi:hypothetical protein